ncbi:hypothetical protein D3C87_1652580 [compost metagenome]
MSGVPNIARVNMNSQTNVALLLFSAPTGSSPAFSTIEQILPCGAMASAIALKWRSVSLKQRMKSTASNPSLRSCAGMSARWSMI